MPLIQQSKIDKIEIVMTDLGYPVIQVRESSWVEDSETLEVIGQKTFRRECHMPDTDITSLPADVQPVAAAVFTQAAKDAYAAA